MSINQTRLPSQSKLPLFLLAVLILLIGIAFGLLAQQTPDVADTAGYIYAGERFADGHGLSFDDPNNEAVGQFFSPFAFQIKQINDARLFLGFPPGLPLLLAIPVAITGLQSLIYFVVPLLAVLGLIFTFLLGRLVTKNSWSALLAAAFLALLPAYWQFGTDAWSEIPSLVFIVAGTFFYLKSRETAVSHRNYLIYSLLGGSLLVYSLFIRYANITFLLSIGLAELLQSPKQLLRPSKRWQFYVILAGGLGLILLFNQLYYGGVSLTSYSPENGWYTYAPFSFAYALGPIKSNLPILLATMWQNFSVVLLLAPIGIFVLPKQHRPLFFLSIVISMFLYSIYRFSPTGINGRFLLPIYPFLTILVAEAATWALQKVKIPMVQVAGAIILLLLVGWRVPEQISILAERNAESEKFISNVKSWVADTPENAVIMSYVLNDQIAYYAERSVLNYRRIPQYDPTVDEYRYDLFEPCLIYTVDSLLLDGTPVFYIEDGNPPLYDSKVVLENYYELVPFRPSPKIFTVQNTQLTAPREAASSCHP